MEDLKGKIVLITGKVALWKQREQIKNYITYL